MDWIDQKYVGLISNRVERFKRIGASTFNMRCPICGDSKRNKYKTRGYIMEKPKVGSIYYCHNCHVSISLLNFLKHLDGDLASQYSRERFLERNNDDTRDKKPDITVIAKPKFIKESPLKNLKKISQLDYDHPVKKYVESRKIPPKFHHKLFYAPKFKAWVNTIIPEKFKLENDEPRMIIPFIDSHDNLIGFTGRSFKKDGLRYVSIMINDDHQKVYGLDNIDHKKKIIVVEGPIDSMFIDNAIAMAGSDLNLSELFPDINKENITIVYDNEPRNKQIVEKIEKAVDNQYPVCIWPDHIEQKDINDMVLAGLNPQEIINSSTYSGLSAKMRLAAWKKI